MSNDVEVLKNLLREKKMFDQLFVDVDGTFDLFQTFCDRINHPITIDLETTIYDCEDEIAIERYVKAFNGIFTSMFCK